MHASCLFLSRYSSLLIQIKDKKQIKVCMEVKECIESFPLVSHEVVEKKRPRRIYKGKNQKDI